MSLLARIRFRIRWWRWVWSAPVIGRYYANPEHNAATASAHWQVAMALWRAREPKL